MQSIPTLRVTLAQDIRITRRELAALRAWIKVNPLHPEIQNAMRQYMELERKLIRLIRMWRRKTAHQVVQMQLWRDPIDVLDASIVSIMLSSMCSTKKSRALLTLHHAQDYIMRQQYGS